MDFVEEAMEREVVMFASQETNRVPLPRVFRWWTKPSKSHTSTKNRFLFGILLFILRLIVSLRH